MSRFWARSFLNWTVSLPMLSHQLGFAVLLLTDHGTHLASRACALLAALSMLGVISTELRSKAPIAVLLSLLRTNIYGCAYSRKKTVPGQSLWAGCIAVPVPRALLHSPGTTEITKDVVPREGDFRACINNAGILEVTRVLCVEAPVPILGFISSPFPELFACRLHRRRHVTSSFSASPRCTHGFGLKQAAP